MKKYSICIIVVSCFIYSSFLLYKYIETRQSFGNISIELGTDGVSPLTGFLKADINIDGVFKIKILPKGETGIPIDYTLKYLKGDKTIPMYGFYPDFKNEVELEFLDTKGNTKFSSIYHIETEPYSGPVLDLDIQINNLLPTYQGLYGFMNKPVLFDQNGDIRWYLKNKEYSMVFSQLKNGNFLIGSESEKIRYHRKYFFEVSPLGEEIKKYTVPNMFHHEIIELENGNLLTSSNSEIFTSLTDNAYREDTIIELDRDTGDIIDIFDLNDVLQEVKPKVLEKYYITRDWGDREMLEFTTGDWIHINSLYLTESGNIIVSLRNTDMVMSINMEKKSLNWILSHRNNYESLQSFTLDVNSEKDEFLYPLVQHSAAFDKNGDMYVFDNGIGRSDYYGDASEKTPYSRVLKYSLNIENKKASLDFSYVSPEFIYTPSRGNVIPLSDSILIGYTYNVETAPRLVEITKQGEVLLDIQENSGDNYYRVVQYDILKGINKL